MGIAPTAVRASGGSSVQAVSGDSGGDDKDTAAVGGNEGPADATHDTTE